MYQLVTFLPRDATTVSHSDVAMWVLGGVRALRAVNPVIPHSHSKVYVCHSAPSVCL